MCHTVVKLYLLALMIDIIYLIIALAVCITVHEASHAWVAYKLGDYTAKMEGRVSLNPLRHMDILGTIMIFIAHFGWGKPVPFNYNNLKHPRRDSALIAMAGPTSNLLSAFIIAILIKHIPNLPLFLSNLFGTIFELSIILFLFNLLPIAPLDGSKLIGLVIPKSKENWYQDFLSKGPMFLIILIILDRLIADISGFSVFGTFIAYGYDLVKALIFLTT